MTLQQEKGRRLDARRLRFYFITDDGPCGIDPVEQARIALAAGAGIVQYRNKAFCPAFYRQAEAVGRLCRRVDALFVVNDDVILAKALGADGVHLGQDDTDPALARAILGPRAVVGLSVSNLDELEKSDLRPCDYIGTGPVFGTTTKADAKAPPCLEGLAAVARRSPVPVVAIGGIGPRNAAACLAAGAAGVAVISAITRSDDPAGQAAALAAALGLSGRPVPLT